MIHKIEIENFYSVRDRQVLDLRAPANAPSGTDRLAPCWRGSTDRAPKVVALFGPNGSGKSNVLRALSFVAWFIGSSFSFAPQNRMPFEPFNDTRSLNAPTRLKIWASGVESIAEVDQPDATQCRYAYEVMIGNGDRSGVLHEAVFYWPSATGRRTRLVERGEDGSIKAGKAFGLTDYRRALEKVLRPNASVISTLAQLNHPFASSIVRAASGVISNIFMDKFELSDDVALREYVDYPDLVDRFNREIQRVDVGIAKLRVEHTPEGPRVRFEHEGLALPMPLSLESHGTQQFIKLYPLLLRSLASGGVAVVDELDAAIHPMILPEIVRWFRDPEHNPLNAQLWMSCQSVSLLEDLSKDEIVFCEKDLSGRTEIYGLNAVKGVRRDDNYYKKYLGGVFGAVPQLG